jgi:hypothetical protein
MMRRNAKHYQSLEQALNDFHLSCYDNKKFAKPRCERQLKLIEKLRNKLKTLKQ